MAKSVLDIIIRTIKEGGADKETVKGLVAVKQSIQQAAAVGASLVAAGYAIKTAFDATVGTMVSYAEQVRDVQRATQLSAEESSRLIQYTDDMGISYETLAKAIKSSADSTDFSIEGLANASDAYLKITDANERAAYAQKLYGKAWVDMVGVLEKGGSAIRSAANEINGSLILTQKAVDQAREYEIAVDNLGDSWQGLKVAIGSEALPAVNAMLVAMQKNIDAGITWRDAIAPVAMFDNIMALVDAHKELSPEVDSATTSYTAWAASIVASNVSTDGMNAALAEQADNLKDISATNMQLLGLTGQMQSADNTYQENLRALAEERTEIEANRALAISQGWYEGSDLIKGYDAALLENNKKSAENAAQHDMDSKTIILGLLEQKLAQDGLTTQELEYLLEKGEAWGIYSEKVVQEAKNAMREVDILSSQINDIPSEKTVSIMVTGSGMDTYLVGGATGVRKRAGGGPVVANQTYIVGEEGPEVFIPNQGGMIIPNGGGGASSSSTISGGGNVYVSLTIASPMTIMDEQTVRKTLLPFIVDGVREAQARGTLK